MTVYAGNATFFYCAGRWSQPGRVRPMTRCQLAFLDRRRVLGGAQREHQRDPKPPRGHAPQAVSAAAFEAVERGVGEIVFVQELDAQPGRGQRLDDASDVVVPLDEGVCADVGGAGVTPGRLLCPWPVVEVPVAQAADLAIDDVEAVRERVVVGDVEEAARRDQGGDRAGPGADVRDPLPGTRERRSTRLRRAPARARPTRPG
jgi:hypothetical protein